MVVGGRELIDTLWNVNTELAQPRMIRVRINRYIMECKYTDVRGLGEAFSELIDTLWNVNPAGMEILAPKLTELIDTLWNVNSLPFQQY